MMKTAQVAQSPTVGSADGSDVGLSVRGISKEFFGVPVLYDIDFDVRPGEVVALLGENGAGKSTLSSVIAGLIQPSRGTMRWRGKVHAPQSPSDALNAGIGLIHQELRLLPDLSVAENVFVGRIPMKNGRVDRELMNSLAAKQLARLGLDIPPTQLVRTLQVAAQQQVEIAKALTLNSKLLILDEPTAALGGEETDRLFSQITSLRNEGYSFIYISHRLEEIARIADRIAVLRDGRLVASHDTAQIPEKQLVEEMVGRAVDRIFPEIPSPKEQEVLTVRNVSSPKGAFRDVSFSVHRGEIVGIAGIVGAGRTELVRAITGADPLASGEVLLEGKLLHLRSPRDAIDAGMVMVPESRKQQGLILQHTLADNMSFGNFDLLQSGFWVSPTKIKDFAARAIRRMGIKGSPGQTIANLSGGNQQKVVIAKWVSRNPKVFILDEPTRGIDVGARAAIYNVIAELASTGMAVVVVSSDLEEVLGLSHRVLVLSRGRQRGLLDRKDANHVAVMELATT